MPWTTPAVVFLIVAALRGGSGNALADASMHERIRRALLPPATRSLTMADLPQIAVQVLDPAAKATDVIGDVPTKPTDVLGAGVETPDKDVAVRPSGSSRDESGPGSREAEREEAAWRKKMTTARVALERDQILEEAMQGRVNGLGNEIAARDDPPQRTELIKQRSRAVVELDRLSIQIEKDKVAIGAIEEDARKKGIPPGWLRDP